MHQAQSFYPHRPEIPHITLQFEHFGAYFTAAKCERMEFT
jgi:hypothetical protein